MASKYAIVRAVGAGSSAVAMSRPLASSMSRRASVRSPSRFAASSNAPRQLAGSVTRVRQAAGLLVVHQRIRDLVELAAEHTVELVDRQSRHAVVGEPVLLEVVRADLLRAAAAADLASTDLRCLRLLTLLLLLED